MHACALAPTILAAFLLSACANRSPAQCVSAGEPAFGSVPEDLEAKLKGHIKAAFSKPRNVAQAPLALEAAEGYILAKLKALEPRRHVFYAPRRDGPGSNVSNIEIVIPGRLPDSLVIGAHYDSAHDTPGANDNGSGAAALIELAEWAGQESVRKPFDRTLRFVFLANEEEPYFNKRPARIGNAMGSRQYVRALDASRVRVSAMISLETLAYYTSEPESQCMAFSPWDSRSDSGPRYEFRPRKADAMPLVRCAVPGSLLGPEFTVGNFVAFVTATGHFDLVAEATTAYCGKGGSAVPAVAIALPGFIPGILWSDHAPFLEKGIPAFMVTDTAPLRYPYYHWEKDDMDTINAIDTAKYAQVVHGLKAVIRALDAKTPPQ